MTRKTQAITLGSALTVGYALLVLDILPTPLISDEIRSQIIPCLPFNGLVTLGSYCLFKLGWGVLTFGDCEPAYQELMREISTARDFLRAEGVSVD